MDFSVILCTYNRSENLNCILSSLESQVLPPLFTWEIIAVDNNSKDDTCAKISEFSTGSCIDIKYVREKNVGLSHARNRGIREAVGDYLLFIEDDEIAGKHLIQRIYDTFVNYGCDCVGGRINLKFENQIPRWLKPELWGFLGYLNHGDSPFQMDSKRYPYGGNMAYKRGVFDQIGGFNVNMGRMGRALFGGEEYDLFQRLLHAGLCGVYQPDAIVWHRIDASRMQKSYFRRLHYFSGLQKGRMNTGNDGRYFLGVPLYIIPQFFRSIKNYASSVLTYGFHRSFMREMIIFNFMGVIIGNFNLWRGR